MVSARQVVSMPMVVGLYIFIILSRPFFKLSAPPYTVPCSVSAEDAISTGSL